MGKKALERSLSADEGAVPAPMGEGDYPLVQDRMGPSALQVLRGMGGIGGIWAVGWGGLGLALGLVGSVVAGFPMVAVLPSLLSWVVAGFLTGAGFALLLTTMERRKSLEELSIPRVGVWGALGGFTVSILVFLLVGVLPFLGLGWALFEGAKAGVLGAISAMGTTAMAKSAGD